MAMIKCPECGKEISDKALTCPNCGVPINMEMPVRVHVERTKKFTGGASSIAVVIDGQFMGELMRGQGFDVDLYPGRHLLELNLRGALRGYSSDFTLDDGVSEAVIMVTAGMTGPSVDSFYQE